MSPQIYSIEGLATGSNDISEGTRRYHIWVRLALHDIKQRYRRSTLGPFWFVLTNIVFVSVLGVLYSTLFGVNVDYYIPFLTAGIILWQFMSILMNEGANVMIEASHLIRQLNCPISIYCHRVALRNFIILLHNIPTLIVVPLLFGITFHWHVMFLPIFLGFFYVNGFAISVVLGVFGTRFRDIQPIMQNLTMVAFFLTPIMWVPGSLKDRTELIMINPVFHYIEVIRAPLLGEAISPLSVIVVLTFTAAFSLLAQLVMHKSKFQVPYWL